MQASVFESLPDAWVGNEVGREAHNPVVVYQGIGADLDFEYLVAWTTGALWEHSGLRDEIVPNFGSLTLIPVYVSV